MKQLILPLFLFCLIFTVNAKSTETTNTTKAKDTTLVSNSAVSYKVTQDQTNLFLNISTSDRKTMMSILQLGVTVFFDIKGKEKKNVYIKYPLGLKRPDLEKGHNSLDENLKDQSILVLIENNVSQEAEFKYFDSIIKFNIYLNNLDITISYSYNEVNALFEYNLKIPKNKINSDSNKDLHKLTIGIKSNSIKQNQERRADLNIVNGGRGSRGQGGKGGPPNGDQGGRGGPPSGSQGGERGGTPNSGTNGKPSLVLIDYWFKANL